MILKTLDDKEIWTFIVIFYRQVLVLANQQNAGNCLYTTNIAYINLVVIEPVYASTSASHLLSI